MSLYVDIKKQLGNRILHIQFHTKKGVLGIFGPSGIGKSITLKCIAGIEAPDSGKIVYNGRIFFDSTNNINLPIKDRGVGYLFQSYALFPHYNVLQNVTSMFKKKEIPHTDIQKLLTLFKIDDLQLLYPHQLSGGQKQRVALARMLAAKPQIILLDEPFSALDYELKMELQNQLTKISEFKNLPVLLVSHDLNDIKMMCEMMICIDQTGNTTPRRVAEVLMHPMTYTEAKLIGSRNITIAIQKSEEELYIPEWNYTLRNCKKGQQIKYIFVEAHHIQLVPSNTSHSFIAEGICVNKYPFSYSITTTHPRLSIEVSPESWEMHGNLDKLYLTLDNEYIMYISE